MGTMGPVREEPGLSLWDAMSVLCRRRRRGAGGRRREGGWGARVGAEGGHTHHSIGNPLRSGRRKGEAMRQQGHEPCGRRASARTGGLALPAPPGGGGPGEGPQRKPFPPTPQHGNFRAFVRGLENRCPLADRPWPGAPACQRGRSGRGRRPREGGPRRGGEVGLYLGIVVQMVPTHFGRTGERGGRQGAPRRRRRSGPACAGGRGCSRRLPEARVSGGPGAAGLSLRER